MQVGGKWNRLATYPAGAMSGPSRSLMWDQIGKMVPAMAAVFGEAPWQTYTTLMVFSDEVGGGSALEHSNSHVGIYNPGFIGNPLLASITAHEIFHGWNVKRLRPADLWPYRLRPGAAHALALGERGHHRLLRRPGDGARRRGRFGGLFRAHRREDGPGGRRARHRAGGRLALHLDRADRRHPVPVLPQGFPGRLHARRADPRRQRQPPLARRRDARAVRLGLQEGPRLHRGRLVARDQPRGREAAPSPSSTRSTSTAASRSPGAIFSRGPASARRPTPSASRESASPPARIPPARSW